MRLDELDKKITSSDLEALETFADRIFGKVGIDVEFTRHFLDRVNDERNGEQITGSELTRLFKQEYKRWGKPIAQMGPDAEAVMKDLATDINMPFALRWDRENDELDLIVKTVMRKKDFKTSNREFEVESGYRMNGPSGLRHTPTIRSRTSSASFLPKAGKRPSLIKRIFSDEFSEEDVNEAPDHEVSMARKDVQRLAKYSLELEEILNNISEEEGLQGWVQAKITKAADYISSVKHYMEGDEVSEEELKEESEIHKFNREDPNNPEVMIQGYGSLMLNQIESSVVRKLEELTKMAERGDFEQIQSLLDKDVMQTMMKAIVDTKAELQSIRRKGGAKSRGINKESILDIFNDDLDEKFDAVKKTVSETGGVGKIVPGINTTVDVGPDEIKKQAAKFGNAVDKDGVPKKTYRK